MHDRAYSILEIKSVDEAERIIRGTATTPAVDRVGDIIDPLGVKFENPLPFLWQHFHDAPIGTVEFQKPTKAGIDFIARLPLIEEEGNLRDRIQEAWQSIKAKLVRAVSIGFRPLEFAFMDAGGIHYNEIEVYELSAVTIPANSEALITSVKGLYGKTDLDIIKALDREFRREAGVPDPEIPSPPEPAATGKCARVVRLDAPPASRQPFVIREIRRARK